MRVHGLLIAAMVSAAIACSAEAQTQLGGASPAGSLPVPANDNALVTDIKRLAPSILQPVQDKLYRIRTGTLSPGLRGADPTTTESQQIAANPDFAAAYRRDPVSTLMLLRWVNQELHRHRGTG